MLNITKSELVNALGAWFIVEHGLPVFMCKPEESNQKTFKLMCGKVVGRVFHDPNVTFDFDKYDEAADKLEGKLLMLDLYQHVGWATLKEDILEAIREGNRIIFIDPITNLVNGIESGEANRLLQEIAQELSSIAKDHDVIINIFCHLKAPDGVPHERGGVVLSSQFSGSRAMMRSCNYMIGMEGNKDPNLSPEERNMRKLVLLEDREFGESGTIPLYWNDKTSLFAEVKE